MYKLFNNKIIYLCIITIITFGLLMLINNNKANAGAGICNEAESAGACVGSGAKCNIKKGWFTFECGKDPDGPSIILKEKFE